MTIRTCLDCGSTRFDLTGAKALDEAKAEGFREGVEAVRGLIRAGGHYDAACGCAEAPCDFADLDDAIRALAPVDRGVLADRGDLDADRGVPRCERCDGTGNDGWCYRCDSPATGCSDCGGTGKPAPVEPLRYARGREHREGCGALLSTGPCDCGSGKQDGSP